MLSPNLDYAAERLNFVLESNRKFGTIKFMFIHSFGEVFQKHGVNVVKLRLDYCTIPSLIQFAGLLKFMPNLKDVGMLETTSDGVPPEQDLPELKKLKILDMSRCDSSILKCFQNAKLTTLNFCYRRHPLHCDFLEDYLKSQKMLTKLTIKSMYEEQAKLFRTDKWPFKLTHLSLLDMGLQVDDYINVVKFLEPQAKTLEELEIGKHFPSLVYEFVFASMTKLKTLSVIMQALPFYERLKENRSITTLIIHDSCHPYERNALFESLQDFLKKLPNIQSVTLIAKQAM